MAQLVMPTRRTLVGGAASLLALPAFAMGTAERRAVLLDGQGNRFPSVLRSPDLIPGLQLWCNAQQPVYKTGGSVPCTTLGDQVATWPDASGHGRTGSKSTTAPTYDPTGINGKPAIKFNGNSYFSFGAFLDTSYSSSMTMFVVARGGPSHTDNRVMCGSSAFYMARNGGTKAITSADGLTPSGFPLSYINDACIDGFAFDGTKKFYVSDGLYAGQGGAGGTASLTNMQVNVTSGTLGVNGQAFQIGALTGSFFWPGWIGEVLVYNRALTLEQCRQVYDYLSASWGMHTKTLVICNGNSLNSGTGSSGGAGQILSTSGTNYPNQLYSLISGTCDVRTDAYPGRTTAQIIAESPSYSDLMILPSTHRKHVVLLWELTNTLASTQSIGVAYQQIIQRASAIRAYRGRVVIGTCLNRLDAYAGFGADAAALNVLLRGTWGGFADGLVDFAADTRLQDPTNTTYFAADKVHLTDVGYGVGAGIADTAIAPWI